MKASEFRIGNLIILPNGEITKVDYQIIRAMFVLEPKPNYNPIPLTEEWLLKFGFKIDGSEKYFYLDLDKINEAYLYFNPLGKGIAIEQNNRECSFDIDLKYVHQLQNLYFALTNKELKIKNI